MIAPSRVRIPLSPPYKQKTPPPAGSFVYTVQSGVDEPSRFDKSAGKPIWTPTNGRRPEGARAKDGPSLSLSKHHPDDPVSGLHPHSTTFFACRSRQKNSDETEVYHRVFTINRDRTNRISRLIRGSWRTVTIEVMEITKPALSRLCYLARPGGLRGPSMARVPSGLASLALIGFLPICRTGARIESPGPVRHKKTGLQPAFLCLARPGGFEPPTSWFVAMRSIQLSYGRLSR